MRSEKAGSCALFFWAVTLVWSQTATSTIQGTVVDESGAVIPGAALKLTEKATNQVREQVSNQEGNFEFRALPRGIYTLEAEKPGFKKELITGIELQVAQIQRLDVRLPVGTVSEAVEVQGSAAFYRFPSRAFPS